MNFAAGSRLFSFFLFLFLHLSQLDPLTLSSVEKAPAILFSRDVQCLRLLCKCCTVDERPLLTDAQSAKLLKRVLEWPHAIRAHCQQDGVVSKGADADADDGSGAGCGERTGTVSG